MTCQTCGKEFQVMYKLKLHVLIHSDGHPFKCNFCGKGFNNKYKMRSHQKTYHKEGNTPTKFGPGSFDRLKNGTAGNVPKPVKTCSICNNFTCTTKQALKDHIKTSHPETAIFVCQTCGKEFKGKKGNSCQYY